MVSQTNYNSVLIPIAAVTNHHKLISLKQHKNIILHFCRSEFQDQMYGAKLKVLTCLYSFGGFRRASVPLAFAASSSPLHFWVHGAFLHVQGSIFSPSDSRHIHSYIFSLSLTLILPLLSQKDPCDSIELIHIAQNNLPNSRFLTATTSVFYKLTDAQGVGDMDISGGPLFSLLPWEQQS